MCASSTKLCTTCQDERAHTHTRARGCMKPHAMTMESINCEFPYETTLREAIGKVNNPIRFSLGETLIGRSLFSRSNVIIGCSLFSRCLHIFDKRCVDKRRAVVDAKIDNQRQQTFCLALPFSESPWKLFRDKRDTRCGRPVIIYDTYLHERENGAVAPTDRETPCDSYGL